MMQGWSQEESKGHGSTGKTRSRGRPREWSFLTWNDLEASRVSNWRGYQSPNESNSNVQWISQWCKWFYWKQVMKSDSNQFINQCHKGASFVALLTHCDKNPELPKNRHVRSFKFLDCGTSLLLGVCTSRGIEQKERKERTWIGMTE